MECIQPKTGNATLLYPPPERHQRDGEVVRVRAVGVQDNVFLENSHLPAIATVAVVV